MCLCHALKPKLCDDLRYIGSAEMENFFSLFLWFGLTMVVLVSQLILRCVELKRGGTSKACLKHVVCTVIISRKQSA